MPNALKEGRLKSRRGKVSESDRQILTSLEKISSFRSVVLYLKTIMAIGLAIYVGNKISNPLLMLFIMLFVAGRQHSLYILNHDASHYTLFKNRAMNKITATIFSVLPFFHHPESWSFVQWRRVHLLHHGFLFTEKDPNYVGRMQAGDTEKSPTGRKLFFSCLSAIPETLKFFLVGKQDYVYPSTTKFHKSHMNHLRALFLPFKNDSEMEAERLTKLIFFTISALVISYLHLWQPFLLFWILPMVLFYPAILKFHDLTEHHWEKKSDDLYINTQSVKRSYLFKLFLSFLPRGFHREHHLYPRVSVCNLPKLKEVLSRYEPK